MVGVHFFMVNLPEMENIQRLDFEISVVVLFLMAPCFQIKDYLALCFPFFPATNNGDLITILGCATWSGQDPWFGEWRRHSFLLG